jgi:hypothetical protein
MTQRQRVAVVPRQQNDHDWNNNVNDNNNNTRKVVSTPIKNTNNTNPFSRGVLKELQNRQRKRKCIRQIKIALASILGQILTVVLCLLGYWFFFLSSQSSSSSPSLLLRRRFTPTTTGDVSNISFPMNNNHSILAPEKPNEASS